MARVSGLRDGESLVVWGFACFLIRDFRGGLSLSFLLVFRCVHFHIYEIPRAAGVRSGETVEVGSGGTVEVGSGAWIDGGLAFRSLHRSTAVVELL